MEKCNNSFPTINLAKHVTEGSIVLGWTLDLQINEIVLRLLERVSANADNEVTRIKDREMRSIVSMFSRVNTCPRYSRLSLQVAPP